MKKPKRYTTTFYIRSMKLTTGSIKELKVHVLIGDIKKTFKAFISDLHFTKTGMHKDDSYGFSIFSKNKERQVRFFVHKERFEIFCDLQMKITAKDWVTDHILNTTLLSSEKKEAYEVLSNSFREEGISIEQFFNKRKFLFIRFLQGDDSNIK